MFAGQRALLLLTPALFLETQYKRRYSYTYDRSRHARISYPYEHLRNRAGLMLRFMKSVTKSVSLSTGTSAPIERIISRKYNAYVKFRI
jgi:hypothetical protein